MNSKIAKFNCIKPENSIAICVYPKLGCIKKPRFIEKSLFLNKKLH